MLAPTAHPGVAGQQLITGLQRLWDERDLKLPAMMRKLNRQEVRAAQAQQPQAASKQARTSIDAAAP